MSWQTFLTVCCLTLLVIAVEVKRNERADNIISVVRERKHIFEENLTTKLNRMIGLVVHSGKFYLNTRLCKYIFSKWSVNRFLFKQIKHTMRIYWLHLLLQNLEYLNNSIKSVKCVSCRPTFQELVQSLKIRRKLIDIVPKCLFYNLLECVRF